MEMIHFAFGISILEKDDRVGLSCVFDALWNVNQDSDQNNF